MSIDPSARIFPWARLIHDGTNLSVGPHAQIDDFVLINAGQRCTIGRFVHIASFCSVIGGGEFTIDDFAGLSAGCRIITSSDDYRGPYLTNPTVPRDLTHRELSFVRIEQSVVVGTNAVIYPGVTVGEGAAVGAGSHVRRDLPPWGIYLGDPARKVGERDREGVLGKRRMLLERIAAGVLD
jgi:galactoside O-acetyltransferase